MPNYDHFLFRTLTDKEAERFREYARTQWPDPRQWPIYHPVCREEWTRLGRAPVDAAARLK